MTIAGLQKMTLLDFPGKVACTVFLAGCNLRCPFCHNRELVLPEERGALAPLTREALLDGKPTGNYDIDTYSKHHGQESDRLRELKSIIIKYLPGDGLHNNQLSATLYDIYNNEEWLSLHAEVEDRIFIPAIRLLEHKSRQSGVSQNISKMIGQNSDGNEALGEREKEVIVSLVQGMTNKEIADHLCISINTVITHRRNIARKLQIHSVAGLTIYAIVNNLVDISSVKL